MRCVKSALYGNGVCTLNGIIANTGCTSICVARSKELNVIFVQHLVHSAGKFRSRVGLCANGDILHSVASVSNLVDYSIYKCDFIENA